MVKTILEYWPPTAIKRLIWVAPEYSLAQPAVRLLADTFGDQFVGIDAGKVAQWTTKVQDEVTLNLTKGRQRDKSGKYPADCLLIIDDMLTAKSRGSFVATLFTTGRHLGCSIIELAQQIFQKDGRAQRLQCTSYWLFGFGGSADEVDRFLRTIVTKAYRKPLFRKYQEITERPGKGHFLYVDMTAPSTALGRYRDSSLANPIAIEPEP